ncbi:MAG: cell envelope integrity protein TolA [Proteobacteria bacterium]|nr:cell envelope integrity protein TolA [Pseudomonadota bacterium]
MNPFLREHAFSLVGSTLLHALVAAAVLAAAWYSVAPKLTMPATIDAYLAAAPARPAPAAPAPVAAPVPVPTPTPAPAPVEAAKPPPPDPAIERARAEAAAAAERRATEAREAHEAQVREAELHARQERDKREALARQQAEAEKRRQAVAEQKRRADALAEQRRQEAEAKQRAARESDLARELAAEEQRTGAVNAGLQARYQAEIRARIERAWIRPPTAKPGLRCIVNVTQVPGGTVTDVKLGDCNGDAAVQQSITTAVLRASPLPTPPDPSLFERKLTLVFAPDA